MGNIKSFLFGLFTAYGIYYITRKDAEGKSILDDLLADPAGFMRTAKDIAVRDTVSIIKEELK